MTKTITDKTLALAGIFQAANLVQQAARKGRVDNEAFTVCIRSIFQTSPANTLAVYGDTRDLTMGLRLLRDHFRGDSRDLEVLKYIVNILHLERQLSKSPDMLHRIGEGIEKAREQLDHAAYNDDLIIARLAGLYSETISTLNPRIIVSGEQGFLARSDIANTVRALLLAAIRSAVLWRQCGGGRWQLFFSRNKLMNTADGLLRSAPVSS